MARRIGKGAFARDRNGTITVRLRDDERELLAGLAAQLREMLVAGEDPSLVRLFPPAYANDEAREREYRSFMHDDLLAGRLAALDTFESSLPNSALQPGEVDAWMATINDLRLVLGTLLDVQEDDLAGELDPNTQEGASRIVYHQLSWLLEQLIAAVAG